MRAVDAGLYDVVKISIERGVAKDPERVAVNRFLHSAQSVLETVGAEQAVQLGRGRK